MKKIYIAMAVLATAMLSSCENEKSFNDTLIGENALVLSLKSGASTRAVDNTPIIEEGLTIDLGQDESGTMFIMEETIQDLDAAWAPATKGTPAYTENVGVLYEKMGAHVGSSDFEFHSMDNAEGSATGAMVDGGWRYQCDSFTGWAANAADDTALDFYLWMPQTDNGIKASPAVTYGKSGDDLTITFGYKSPATAELQKDLILAARTITKGEAKEKRVNGVPVLFNHALTGVKFAIENYDKTKNITIKSVKFTGLYEEGTCTITPAKENNYRDNTTTYSSKDGRVAWTLNSTRGTTEISSGGFGEPVEFIEGGSFGNNGKYPASFSDAGATDNLNKADASQTFWLIPQAMSNDVELIITYTFGSTTEQTWTIAFGEVLAAKNVVWKAGELRTYTIKINDVNVKIEDEVHMTDGTTYTKDTKNNIHITNTGNTDAFIRAAIIGQWLNNEGKPVFGFTDKKYNFYAVASWYEDQFVSTAAGVHGSFTDLPGYKNGDNPLNGWYLCTDGFYYYSQPVAPDKVTGFVSEDDVYVEQKLFTSYTVGTAPTVTVSGVNTDIHFTLEISTQAIAANKIDGSHYGWQEAWKNATGTQPTIKTNN